MDLAQDAIPLAWSTSAETAALFYRRGGLLAMRVVAKQACDAETHSNSFLISGSASHILPIVV
jgi:hypothetical protein